jgi:hypothetical protein
MEYVEHTADAVRGTAVRMASRVTVPVRIQVLLPVPVRAQIAAPVWVQTPVPVTVVI